MSERRSKKRGSSWCGWSSPTPPYQLPDPHPAHRSSAQLFERVVLPTAVKDELSVPVAPPMVRRWIADPPPWLEVVEAHGLTPIPGLHEGEAVAIALAASLKADLLLIDERAGLRAAEKLGMRVTGTLGVLDLAAARGLIDFAEAIRELERTSFRRPVNLINALLAKHNT